MANYRPLGAKDVADWGTGSENAGPYCCVSVASQDIVGAVYPILLTYNTNFGQFKETFYSVPLCLAKFH